MHIFIRYSFVGAFSASLYFGMDGSSNWCLACLQNGLADAFCFSIPIFCPCLQRGRLTLFVCLFL